MAQTCSLIEGQKFRLKVCQIAMKRNILGVKWQVHVRNTELRSKNEVMYVGKKTARLKRHWAGHVCRMDTDRCANVVELPWGTQPQGGCRRRGRSRKRCLDDLDAYRKYWPELALNREKWLIAVEAFAQQAYTKPNINITVEICSNYKLFFKICLDNSVFAGSLK